MQTYEKYFTQDELERLPMYGDDAVKAQWQSMVDEAEGMMRARTAPASDAAKGFALRWLRAFERDTGGDARLAARINAMALAEREKVGLPAPLLGYMMAAVTELKLDAWARHLPPDVVERMRRHFSARGREWGGLVTDVRAGMAADPDGRGVEAAALARRWMDLFHDMVGTDPETVVKFRHASATEPVLRMGPGIDDEMIGWLRRALAT